MTKLNQILAIEKGAKAHGDRTLTAAYHTLQKPALLAGLSRTYRPKDDDGEKLPGEATRVQVTADGIIAEVSQALGRMFDVAAAKDWTNCRAKADVVVDGAVLIEGVPVTYLLYLEKQLVNLQTFIRKLPVLDPAEEWVRDQTSDAWRTHGFDTTRTKKVPRNHVKAPATDKHPAQVDVYSEDVVVGYWSTVKFSGAMPAARINVLLARVQKLLDAVKMARENANTIEVEDREVGEALFAYLLA